MDKKIYRVQVPNILIRTPKQYNELYLYVMLKSIDGNKPVERYSHDLLKILKWKDARTLKKYLSHLKEQGFIDYDFDNLPHLEKLVIRKEPISTFTSKTKNGKDSYYTQIDIETIRKVIEVTSNCEIKRYNKITKTTTTTVEDLKERALALMYYYESWYMKDQGYSCPAYSQIHNDTGISNEYIKIINKILHKNKLVDVYVGDKTKNIEGFNKRERNKYTPKCNRNKSSKVSDM